MTLITSILIAIAIVSPCFIVWYLYKRGKHERALTSLKNQEIIKNWETIKVPDDIRYEIIFTKDIKAKDTIIHFGYRFEILQVSETNQDDKIEYGPYFKILGRFLNTHPLDPAPIKCLYLTSDSPIIKCI